MARAPGDALERARSSCESGLSAALGRPVAVRFTRARCEPVRWSWTGPARRAAIDLRLHERFAAAPPEVLAALAAWIRAGRRAEQAGALLDRWIAAEIESLPRKPRRRPLEQAGRVHDLAPLARELLIEAFASDFPHGAGAPEVTWGRRAPSRTRGTLRLGSYVPDDNLVRLHPVLDASDVPVWFVRYVLFHEHLHAALPPRPGRGSRWVHHDQEFRRRERRYPDYSRAIAWEGANLPRLVRRARRLSEPSRSEPARPASPLRMLQRALFG